MWKQLIAGICAIFMMASVAAASEERILQESTKGGNLQQFLQNLSKVKMGEVNGYDPETNTIYTAAVLVWVCQNQAPVWQAACANKSERFMALKARNGWGDTITSEELQAQGQGKGIYFPYAAPPAAAVAAVTPEQLKALETSIASAQTALTQQVLENKQGLAALQGQLAAKESELASLREAVKTAPTPETISALEAKIVAGESARRDLKTQLQAQIGTAANAAALEAVAPAASQASAALKATGEFRQQLVTAEGKANRVAAAASSALRTASDAKTSADKANEGLGLLALAVVVIAFLVVGNYVWTALLGKKIDNVAEKAGVKVHLFDSKQLKNDLRQLRVGQPRHFLPIPTKEGVRKISFELAPDGKYHIGGISGQVNTVGIDAVVGCVYNANTRGCIDGVQVSVFKMAGAA